MDSDLIQSDTLILSAYICSPVEPSIFVDNPDTAPVLSSLCFDGRGAGPVEKQIGSCGLTGGESMAAGGIDSHPERGGQREGCPLEGVFFGYS